MRPDEALATLAATGVAPPDGETAARLSVGIGTTLERVVEETFPFISAGGGELKFIHAPYGRGKTHFLRALQNAARRYGFVTSYVDCKDYGSPFQSLVDTYRAISRNMRPPTDDPDGRTGAGPVIEGRFDGERVAANKLLSPEYRNLVRSYHQASADDECEDLRGRLEALLNSYPGIRATPGKLSSAYKWLPRPLGKLGSRNAGSWLRCLLSLPHALGYSGFLVLFDETETVLNRGASRRIQQRLAHMRTFVDYMAIGGIRGCAVYCAALDGFVDDARSYLEALSQRIERLRLPEAAGDGRHANGTRNPLATWVDLDELTDPGPNDEEFFFGIADRIADLGTEAGMSEEGKARALERMKLQAPEYTANIQQGKTREYVKFAAACVAQELYRS